MTRRYTAADFANAKFAELGKHGLRAHKSAGDSYWQRDGIKRATNEEMAAAGWVPVPTKPTITESETVREEEAHGTNYWLGFRNGFVRAGGEIIPDPEPTDEELLAGIIRNIDDWQSITSPELLAKYLNTAGVTPPNVKDN